jgi:uncharacterized membrane protein YbaN (DUF454 family)
MNLWTLLGMLFLALGFIGALLPIMPTVPFVLVAAACFARSSPKMHRWMRQHRTFGPTIRNWENNRCVSRKMKVWAITMMTLGGGISTWLFVPPGWMSRAVFGAFLAGDLVVLLLRECPPEPVRAGKEKK